MFLRAPQMFNSKWSSASAVVVEIPGSNVPELQGEIKQ
jgi:hypothetical protein